MTATTYPDKRLINISQYYPAEIEADAPVVSTL
jgi:hypothetical protein